MKRYLLFTGDNYYPCSHLEDFAGAFDHLDEAISHGGGEDWGCILDTADSMLYVRDNYSGTFSAKEFLPNQYR